MWRRWNVKLMNGIEPGRLGDPPPIRWLAAPSSEAWLAQALAHPQELLVDHAHCERKAAHTALRLMGVYPAEPGLAEALSPLAREELQHFETILTLLERRGWALRQLSAPPYGGSLKRCVASRDPERMLDQFLVAGLIEARSHERLGLLARHCPDQELASLYHSLLASEARHFGLYWVLAERRFSRVAVKSRLRGLAAVEAQILSQLHRQPRMHS